MEHLIHSRLSKILGIAMLSTAALYGATYSEPANAEFYDLQTGEQCMADAAGFKLNCTANDIQVSKVDNIRDADGNEGPVTCQLEEYVTFTADVQIITTANERYDYAVYLPEKGTFSAQDSGGSCSILVGKPDNNPGQNLEPDLIDACADITKAGDSTGIHDYPDSKITILCRDADSSGKADFNYCASWENKEAPGCSVDDPSAPGTPSKCRCDTFDIDIRVDPPEVTKNLASSSESEHDEPGGNFTYDISIKNPNPGSSMFITSLTDHTDEGANGSFETTLDLWGSSNLPSDLTAASDGVYLVSSNCAQPSNGGEIAGGGTYTCQFTVHIKDTDLATDPEPYDDVIKTAIENSLGEPILDGDSCPAGVYPIDGEHCSDKVTVTITNLAPTIDVAKTPDTDEILEPGGDILYTVEVTSLADSWDDPLKITSLVDDKFGDLTTLTGSTCTTGQDLYIGTPYTCTFTQKITGSPGYSHTNEVTAKATDNEGGEATDTDTAKVTVVDIKSAIDLDKTASPTSVPETGDDPSVKRSVAYTFTFEVLSEVEGNTAIDDVIFAQLLDTAFGDLTDDCNVGGTTPPTPLLGYTLSPGQSASCTITREITGDADTSHYNDATISGEDTDGQYVEASDDETVNFTPLDPDVDIDFATSLLVVLKIENGSIEDVDLTSIKVKGIEVAEGAEYKDVNENLVFVLRNTFGGSHNDVDYPYCNLPQPLAYAGDPDDTYSCAFTIELYPGIDSVTNIDFQAGNGITATVEDNEGDDATTAVSVQVIAVE